MKTIMKIYICKLLSGGIITLFSLWYVSTWGIIGVVIGCFMIFESITSMSIKQGATRK